MKRLMLAIPALAAILAIGIAPSNSAPAQDKNNVILDGNGKQVTDPRLDPMRSYYNNTYTCYWPGEWECHHWWNPDGTEQFFQIEWMSEGLVGLKVVDGMHDSFMANGQWCSHNAKGKPRGVDEPVERPKAGEVNNNRNGCQPVVDAVPGDHWYKLHLNGNLQSQREQYTLMPGHQ